MQKGLPSAHVLEVKAWGDWDVKAWLNCNSVWTLPSQHETDHSRGVSLHHANLGTSQGASIQTASTRTVIIPTPTLKTTRTATRTVRILRRRSTCGTWGWVLLLTFRNHFVFFILGSSSSEAATCQVRGVGGGARGGRGVHQPRRRERSPTWNCLQTEKQVIVKEVLRRSLQIVSLLRFENMAIAEPNPPKSAPKKYQVKRFKVMINSLTYWPQAVLMHEHRIHSQGLSIKHEIWQNLIQYMGDPWFCSISLFGAWILQSHGKGIKNRDHSSPWCLFSWLAFL